MLDTSPHAHRIQPKGWPRPRGYANGMLASGRLLAIGGQVGSRPPGMTLARGLVPQFAQAIDNVLAVVRAAGGAPTDIISLTIFVTELDQYVASTQEIRTVWRSAWATTTPRWPSSARAPCSTPRRWSRSRASP